MAELDPVLSAFLGVDVWADERCPPGTGYLIQHDPAVLELYWRNTLETPGES